MKKPILYIVLATLIGGGVLVQNLISMPVKATQPATETPTATATVVISSYGQCAYMWAYHNAGEVTAILTTEVTALDPNAKANASFYGEDCLYADGHSTFSAMETDFYIHVPMPDLTDEAVMGEWISKVLQIVTEIPREKIQGNYGFVEFWFEKDSEHVIVRVPIQQYLDEAQGLTGADLYRMFYVKP